ncbi:MAG: transketolase [Brevinema sp.]
MKTPELVLNMRYYIIDAISHLGFGHLGGSLSAVEMLSVLYNEEMNVDPKNPKWDKRDYFVLSKGHAGPALYTILALKGYFPLSVLHTLNGPNTTLPSHVDQKLTPGVDATSGSLGQGLSIAVGIAHGLRIQNKSQRVYTIVGDGEIQEGQCWEAIKNAAHFKLSNLVMFIDKNNLQLDGATADICQDENLADALRALSWNVYEIDGHNLDEIREVLANAKACGDKPTAVVANTIKGKGVPEFETEDSPHHVKLDDTTRPYLVNALENLKQYIKGDSHEL